MCIRDRINAVQTILANTQSKGTTIDQVNAALDELNKYADQTIYNFTEMTRNIGTFTAAEMCIRDRSKDVRPGVWDGEITEREYFGDLIRNTSRYQTSDKLNDDINISNEISIVADPFAYQNFHAMRYVEFMGAKWKISSVEVQYPRLILTVGGVYND